MPDNSTQSGLPESPAEATTYGGLLRIARENKDLSIDQVSSQLRITPDQIQGLESDNYHVFPTPVYARAHLRSYARLLGVDEAKIISLFNASLAPEEKDPRSFIRKTTHDLAPYHDEQPKNPIGKFIAGILFLAVLIALGWIGFNYYMAQKGEAADPAAKTEPVTTTVQAAAEPAAPAAPAAAEKTEAKPENTEPAAAAAPSAADASATAATATATAAAAAQTAEQDQAARDAELKLKLQQEAEAKAAAAKAAEEKRLAEEAAKKEETDPAETTPGKVLTLTHNDAEGRWDLIVPKSTATTYKVTIGAAKDGECWFGIYENNKLAYNAQIKNGATRTYEVAYPFKVSVGNRAKGFVQINGNPVDINVNDRRTSTVFTIVQK